MPAKLDDMRLFAAMAEAGSLSAAAHASGVSKQTLSRRLVALESALGVELARRTTRSFQLTDLGRAYAAQCAAVVRLADDANAAVTSQLDTVGGTLRVTADHSFGDAFLPELVARFGDAHPAVKVDIWLTARRVDLLAERFDVAFRIGPPPDVTHLAATRIGDARLVTVASAEYVAGCGVPATIDDLARHRCISSVPTLSHHAWPLLVDGALRMVPVDAHMRVNSTATATRAALAGAGFAHLPEFAVRAAIADGRLVRALPMSSPELGGVHVVYPHSGLLAPKVTEFVAAARAWIEP